jgi:hypothetical protein
MPRFLSIEVEIGLVKGTLARLVDDRLARDGRQFADDIVPRLAADQDAPHRPRVSDPGTLDAARELSRRRIGEIRPVPLAGVDDENAAIACRRERPAAGRDGGLQQADIVAQTLAEAAPLDEIALHVDDHERRLRRREGKGSGRGLDRQRHHPRAGHGNRVMATGSCRMKPRSTRAWTLPPGAVPSSGRSAHAHG